MSRGLTALRNGDKKTDNANEGNPQNSQNSPDKGFEAFEGSAPEAFSNFRRDDWAAWDEEDWQAAFDERAAILEYDEGLTRSEASRLARKQIDQQRRAKWN
jgi:hypothetical protein